MLAHKNFHVQFLLSPTFTCFIKLLSFLAHTFASRMLYVFVLVNGNVSELDVVSALGCLIHLLDIHIRYHPLVVSVTIYLVTFILNDFVLCLLLMTTYYFHVCVNYSLYTE